MSATFTTLFERGRYSSRGRRFGLDEEAQKQRTEQQERFAVGMIGFAIEHDAHFKTHFIDAICGLRDLSTTDNWEVFVEPENWGDLVLKNRPLDWLLVVEFKIEAGLAEHQNPSKAQFREPGSDGQCAGYGCELARIAVDENWKRLKYVTVEKNKSWSPTGQENISLTCAPMEWRQFLRTDISQESDLESDVYDCLSYFGISTFTARRMKQMKFATHATQPLALLIGVLEKESRAKFRRKLLDVSAEALGIDLDSIDFPKIARIVQTSGGTIGWFGYESNPPKLSVWFYCNDSIGAPSDARNEIRSVLEKASFAANAFQEDGSNIGVFCKAEDSEGDQEWFTKVLSAFKA